MGAVTNRDHYVSAKEIMGTYASLAAYAGDSPMLMRQSERTAWARAWDAYCKTRGRLAFLRGIPGGFCTLTTLERLSPKFHSWLDEPYDGDAVAMSPKAELESSLGDTLAPMGLRPARLTEDEKRRIIASARSDVAEAYAEARTKGDESNG